MSQQPTPEEWTLVEDIGDFTILNGAGQIIFEIHAFDTVDESRADLELMVAARNAAKQTSPAHPLAAAQALPELVAALRRIQEMIDKDIRAGRCFYAWAIRAEARAAIAAATGGNES